MVKYPIAILDHVIFQHLDELNLDETAGINKLLSLIVILPWHPDVIFLDPWANCLEEENITRNSKKAIANIMAFDNRWVIVHHRSKPGAIPVTTGEMLRGSGVPAQKAHTIVGYFPNPTKEEEVTMKFKSRGPCIPSITIEVDENGVINVTTPSWAPRTQEEKAQVAIWDLLTTETARMVTPEKTVGNLEAEIAATLGISEPTVKKAWQKMASQGIINTQEQGKEKYLSISPMELEPNFPI